MDLKVRVTPRVNEGDIIEYGGGDGFAERFASRAKDLGDAIRDVTSSMAEQIRSLDAKQSPGWAVDEISMSFSLDLEAEAGVVIAKAKTTAGFEIALTWKRE